MLKKTTLFVLLAGLLLAACAPAAAPVVLPGPAAPVNGLSVSGRGLVHLQPDVAYVVIGVHTQAADVSQAVSQNAQQVASVMAALADQGVAAVDMQTSNFSLYTGESFDPMTGLSTGPTYTVDNTVNVTVRDLSNMGELLDGAISAGANSIWGVNFDLYDKSAARAEARNIAVQNAIDEARALAEAAGLTLGEIVSVSYTDTGGVYYPPYGMGMGGGGGAAEAATSIVPGQITVNADVYITFAIQ